jgi:hypothetical protein
LDNRAFPGFKLAIKINLIKFENIGNVDGILLKSGKKSRNYFLFCFQTKLDNPLNVILVIVFAKAPRHSTE